MLQSFIATFDKDVLAKQNNSYVDNKNTMLATKIQC